jgi:beta-lactamase regulating signal transducer with metallopeptidase domain
MENVSRALLTFLLNSLWQVPLAAGIAALACRLLRRSPASHRHAVWVAAMFAAIVLPLASIRPTAASAGPQYSPSLADRAVTGTQVVAARPAPAPSTGNSRDLRLTANIAGVLLAAYLLLLAAGLARLTRNWLITARIRREAHPASLSAALRCVWSRCEEAFELSGVELLTSSTVTGPVTAGRVIILPESMLNETSEDVLTTAIGHEMAHIARRDFDMNLLYELLRLPIGFHPAAWLMRREIERTREMSCDEMVTERLIDAHAYARSIMSIAGSMVAVPGPGHTLGVFDGNMLEARIRRLMENRGATIQRARLRLATGLVAVGACAVIASTLALTARAQGPAAPAMKAAEEAYNRGDTAEAVARFEEAVRIEPANLKARLLLAHALLRDYSPGSGDTSLAERARQQYMDVLSKDAGNKSALQGLMTIDMNFKRFNAAREWAAKAIQADSTDKDSYYTIGFIDWAVTYPDYAHARTLAGMNPWDPGPIPDASLRNGVRAQHAGHIEEGFRMLQVALQIDPNYSDAMAYMNLLYRIQAGLADSQEQYAEYTAKADAWVVKALDARKGRPRTAAPQGDTLDINGPVPGPWTPPPPPPPPPPPKPSR